MIIFDLWIGLVVFIVIQLKNKIITLIQTTVPEQVQGSS